MRIIGLLGGVASGKSEVGRRLSQLGAGLLNADQVGHEVLRLPRVEVEVRKRWGNDVFAADGRIDRARLARIVFASTPEAPTERAFLEEITHPEIARSLREQIEQFAATGVKWVVLDAALLLEADWKRWCDKLVYVDCSREMRLKRALARGWSQEEFAAREAAQESLEQKRKLADATIDNSGSLERTQAQIEQFWASLVC